MVLGPLVAAPRDCGSVSSRTPARLVRAGRLAGHVAAVAAVLARRAVARSCRLWIYVAGVAWVGGALSLLRSFAEHRWSADGSALCRRAHRVRFLSLLFLNNNLHYTHHERPGVPWFQLPAAHRAIDGDAQAPPAPACTRATASSPGATSFRSFDQPVVPTTAVSRAVRRRSEAEAASSAGEASNLLASRARAVSGDRAEDRDGPVEGGGEAAVGAQPGDLGLAGIS